MVAFILPLIALAASAAQAGMQYQQARGQAAVGRAESDFNNKEVLRNYRRNLERLSEGRIDARRASLAGQADIGANYRNMIHSFQAAYSENWGQSAALYMESLARRGAEDIEQVKQNLETTLKASGTQGEDLRLGLQSQLSAPPTDISKQVLAAGLIDVGSRAIAAPFEIQAAQRASKIQDLQYRRAQMDVLASERDLNQFRSLLSEGPVRASQINAVQWNSRW